MKEHEVLRCQIQEWYPRFCKISFKTNIHTLHESFVSFLLQDGLFLPRSSEAMPSRTLATCPALQSEDYHHWREEDDDEDEPDLPSFPDLEAEIKASIQQLGGCVIPKLNWSAPVDTAWISASGSLKCTNFAEVSLLLKASETLWHDLCHAFDACEDRTRERPPVFVLALKKWYDLRPEMEFRAFVREHCLVGVSQREVTSFYPSLLGREEYLGSLISEFFVDSLCEKFDLENYSFDCYVTKDGKVKLMDFNTWGGSTLPLLFTWDELEDNYSTSHKKLEQKSRGFDDENGAENCNVKAEKVEDNGKSGNGSNGQSKEHSGDSHVLSPTLCSSQNSSVKGVSTFAKLRSPEQKIEVRIVRHKGLVQPSFRATSGVPIDLVDKGPGSSWEQLLQKLEQEIVC